METHSFIGEKYKGKDTYQALRNRENPREVIVLKNGKPFDYGDDFNQFWINLK